MPEHNDTNSAAPAPPDVPATAQVPPDNPITPSYVGSDPLPGTPISQPAPNDLGSPVVSAVSDATKYPAGEGRWPGYMKFAVIANLLPIATAAGFALFAFYWSFLASAAGSESDASGLVSFLAFIVLVVALVALSIFAVPFVIALATRKRVAAYISSVVGVVGTCLAAVLLVATFAS